MKNSMYILLMCLLVTVTVFAQLPHDFRSEQIFLGVARTEWAVNDTIYANGVVTCPANKHHEPYSRYLYIELLNASDSVIVRQKVACNQSGIFHAGIPTVSVYDEGVYYLRAYTNLMRNFSGESFAMQPVLIGKIFPKRNLNVANDVTCNIYPDGGFLVENHVQGITVSLTDNLGDAIGQVNTIVVDDRGDTICVGKTQLSGLVNLKFIPMKGRTYRLIVDHVGNRQFFDVPAVVGDRMKLQCVVSGDKLKFEILNPQDNLNTNRLYIYSKENGLTRVSPLRPSGVVMLANSPGLVSAFLTDSVGIVLSEATAISRYKMEPMPHFADTISVCGVDSLLGVSYLSDGKCVSVRVAADDERWIQSAEEQRYLADYTSPLPFPERFVEEDKKGRAVDLQAWLASAKFCRFDIREALAKDTAIYRYMPEMKMTISGEVTTTNNAVFRCGMLVAYNTNNNYVYDTAIGNDGRFRMAVDDFDDGTTFFLQSIDKDEKVVDSQIKVDDENFPAVHGHRKYELYNSGHVDSKVIVTGSITGRVLPDIVVRARVRHEEPVSRKKFYSNDYADREKIEKFNYLTLFDILKAMPSIYLTEDAKNSDVSITENTRIYNRRGFSTLTGKESMPILLDGTRVMGGVIANTLNMSADEIESVEVLQAWQALAYTWGALDGAIKVTTRGSNKSVKVRSKGTFYTPMGLSVAKKTKQNITPGSYRLLVDVLTQNGVTSYERGIVVK